jgi:hypothetical protein
MVCDGQTRQGNCMAAGGYLSPGLGVDDAEGTTPGGQGSSSEDRGKPD